MNKIQRLTLRRELRKKRNRVKTRGTNQRPRLSVFRSRRTIYCQLIDDQAGRTIVSAFGQELIRQKGETKTVLAKQVGLLIAKKAKKSKIAQVVFDRGGYAYHGRVKALAEGAREGGLEF